MYNRDMGKNILIVGNSAKEYALAKLLSRDNNVYVAPGNDAIKEFAETVDIRETNIPELLEFALENSIDITIASSEEAIKADIATFFEQNEQMVFAPTAAAAETVATSKSFAKKFMYKLKLPSPKFGIFDKPQYAVDYIKNKCEMPVVIKTDEYRKINGMQICSSQTIAKNFIEESFLRGEKRIIIEDFVYGNEFSFYVITDGYKALPIGSLNNYKFTLDGDGGLLTSGMGACSPNFKLTMEHENFLMNEIVFPVLDELEAQGSPYCGILGIDGVLEPDNNISVLEFGTFFKDHDAQGLLELIDEDICHMFEECVIGSFSDNYDYIKLKDDYALSCVLSAGKLSGQTIKGLDSAIDDNIKVAHYNTRKNEYLEYETTGGNTLLVTATAKTISKAKNDLYDAIDLIDYNGKHYRKDICSVLNV